LEGKLSVTASSPGYVELAAEFSDVPEDVDLHLSFECDGYSREWTHPGGGGWGWDVGFDELPEGEHGTATLRAGETVLATLETET